MQETGILINSRRSERVQLLKPFTLWPTLRLTSRFRIRASSGLTRSFCRWDLCRGILCCRSFYRWSFCREILCCRSFYQLAIRTSGTIYIDYNPTHEFWAHTEVLREDDAQLIILTYLDNEALPDTIRNGHRNGTGEGGDIQLLGEQVEGVRLGASRQCAGRYIQRLDAGG